MSKLPTEWQKKEERDRLRAGWAELGEEFPDAFERLEELYDEHEELQARNRQLGRRKDRLNSDTEMGVARGVLGHLGKFVRGVRAMRENHRRREHRAAAPVRPGRHQQNVDSAMVDWKEESRSGTAEENSIYRRSRHGRRRGRG